MATGGTLFEELGFYYVGPVDAHDLENLVPILENIRDKAPSNKPILLHVQSIKGKGYIHAEKASDCYHGVAKFDIFSGVQMKSAQKSVSFTDTFAQALINLAEQDKTVCGITGTVYILVCFNQIFVGVIQVTLIWCLCAFINLNYS